MIQPELKAYRRCSDRHVLLITKLIANTVFKLNCTHN